MKLLLFNKSNLNLGYFYYNFNQYKPYEEKITRSIQI